MQNTTLSTGLTVQQAEQNDQKLLLPADFILSLRLTGYDAIVGSSAQVSAGMATHTSINAAIAAVPVFGSILILRGNYHEDVGLNNVYNIVGQGPATIISGNFTLDHSLRSSVSNLSIAGNIYLTSNSQKNFITNVWLSVGTFLDLGTDNQYTIIN
jgi:hypothetical protein